MNSEDFLVGTLHMAGNHIFLDAEVDAFAYFQPDPMIEERHCFCPSRMDLLRPSVVTFA